MLSIRPLDEENQSKYTLTVYNYNGQTHAYIVSPHRDANSVRIVIVYDDIHEEIRTQVHKISQTDCTILGSV